MAKLRRDPRFGRFYPRGGGSGSDTEVMFNNAGSTAGDPALTWDKVTETLNATNFVGDGSGLTGIVGVVTNGDSHDHAGGDGAQIAHTGLSSIGTNAHSAIDNFISSKAAASGLASLDGSSKVVQNPASATTTPGSAGIPIADGSGKLAAGWIPLIPNGFTGTAMMASGGRTIVDIAHGVGAAPTIANGYEIILVPPPDTDELHSSRVTNVDATNFDIELDLGLAVTANRTFRWTIRKVA